EMPSQVRHVSTEAMPPVSCGGALEHRAIRTPGMAGVEPEVPQDIARNVSRESDMMLGDCSICAASFCADGRRLIVAASDDLMRVYDIVAWKEQVALVSFDGQGWASVADGRFWTGDEAGAERLRFADGAVIYRASDLPHLFGPDRIVAALRPAK
ncbi:MAG: hypothetical protein RDV41_14540, partial [Planctomycetota bacterium]|nr:hypothetical protein [Planctomycetota bacterium]